MVKVGSQLFTAEGPRAVQKLARLGLGVFLDLKFHDIPNTVAGSVAAAAQLPGVRMMTLHTSGGLAMMRAAREAVAGRKRRPALLGVTILTSLDTPALRRVGLAGPASARVLALARLAKAAVGDQARVATPAEAIRAGANYLVVGRPITKAADPRMAAGAIAAEIAAARGK